MKTPYNNESVKKEISHLNAGKIDILIQKLTSAYEARDFSMLTNEDFCQLVKQGHLHSETAARLAKEGNHVG